MSARPSAWARWRADLRLARRQVWRAKGSSLLVAALIALPVFALAGSAVYAQSHVSTAADRTALQLGHAQSWIEVAGPPDPNMRQAIDEPYYQSGTADTPAGDAPTTATTVIPAGTDVIEIGQYGYTVVKTATGTAQIAATVGPAWSAALAGHYTIIDGTAPTSPDEVMVTPGVLGRTGAAIGGTITLPDADRSFTVSGTLRALDEDPGADEIFLPAAAASAASATTPRWYVLDWQPNYAELQDLNHKGFIAYARDLALNPPAGAMLAHNQSGEVWQVVLVGSIAAAFSGYLVVLLAGAAFAVSARRQERSLAVATSVGARRGDVFRVVVLQGTVLGALAGIGGALLGIGASIAFMLVVDDDVRGSFWSPWALRVPWLMIAGIAVFAVFIGTIAAILPARAASRGDVISALRGARRPVRLNPRRPLWGLALMILGLAATVAAGLWIAALDALPNPDYDDPLRVPLAVAMVLGPIVFQIGFILGGHWMLAMIARVISRFGLAPRVAGRDAAASPSRIVPAFAAIAACVFLASFALTLTNMSTATSNRSYSWSGHKGAVMVFLGGNPRGHESEYRDAATTLLAPSRPSSTVEVDQPAMPPTDPKTGDATDPDFPDWEVASPAALTDGEDPTLSLDGGGFVSIVAPDKLASLLGEPVPAAALTAYRDGTALVVAQWTEPIDTDGSVTLTQWTAADLTAYRDGVQAYYAGGSQDLSALPKPEAVHKLPARRLDLQHPQGQVQIVIAPTTADTLGMQREPQLVYAMYAQDPGNDVVDALVESASNMRLPGDGVISVSVERGPAPISPFMWVLSGIAGALVLGAGAICLGLARFERRPDDATLAAVGATRRLRRRVNGWQAIIVVGIGTIVGTLAGLICAWGYTQTSNGSLLFGDTPWAWLAAVALGLPLVMAAASWLIPPRAPDLTRRTAIA